MTHRHLDDILQAMLTPEFYPHAVAAITHRETHISHVLLTGRFAYKIKKPVDFGFLDFSTLEKRHRYCRAEVELNRRLSRDIYHGVIPITAENGRIRLGGRGEALEYAVQMAQLDDAKAMSRLLAQSGLGPAELQGLARVLATFYQKASVQNGSDSGRLLQSVWGHCEDNFKLLQEFSGRLFDARKFEMIESACRSFFGGHRPLFQRRIQQGWFRDCHGDLRSEHIYFTDDGIQIIDCIEFNSRLRQLDVLCDLAFLAMDLDSRGFSNLGLQLVETIADLVQDDDAAVFLNFYSCYRAVVRLKVSCLRFRELDPSGEENAEVLNDVERYLSLALHYADSLLRPRLWVVCGMPATGKSAIARELARRFGTRVLRSDVLRKSMFGHAIESDRSVPFQEGMYSQTFTDRTYAELLQAGRRELEQGRSVVLDATFAERSRRRAACDLARDTSSSILFVECRAPDALIRRRLAQRETAPSISDARLVHFEEFRKRFEPVDEIDGKRLVRVDTTKPLQACIRVVMRKAIET